MFVQPESVDKSTQNTWSLVLLILDDIFVMMSSITPHFSQNVEKLVHKKEAYENPSSYCVGRLQ